ncbi:MAG: PfkB family carbohydrate kinase [Thermoproteota archaeon]
MRIKLGFVRLDILAMGEILVDMIPTKPVRYTDVMTFEKCFGGAPFNFAVGASRLGSKVGALCAVGSDPFGEFLLETLEKNGIDTSQVKIKKARTTLTFVVRHKGGERGSSSTESHGLRPLMRSSHPKIWIRDT